MIGATITSTERTRARLNLAVRLAGLRKLGPRYAGAVARIEAVLELENWPPSTERFAEFCEEVLKVRTP